MDQRAAGGAFGHGDGGRRCGEVDDAVGAGERRDDIVGDEDARGPDAGEEARILADRLRALAFDRAGQDGAFGLADHGDQRAAHATGSAQDDQLHRCHRVSPSLRGLARQLRTDAAISSGRVAVPLRRSLDCRPWNRA